MDAYTTVTLPAVEVIDFPVDGCRKMVTLLEATVEILPDGSVTVTFPDSDLRSTFAEMRQG